jgi:amino acid permease
MEQRELNLPMTILAIINGMIGGSILVLPIVSMDGGYILTLIIILFVGIFSFYSCYISIIHLGDQHDLDQTLLRHFNGSKIVKIFYDFSVWSGFVLV